MQKFFPRDLAHIICKENNISGNISELSNKLLKQLSESINTWVINPTGSEGYRTAEVTLGGVDTNEISSKTMMSKKNPGLFFIGEVVDVTGHLGGYNFPVGMVIWFCSWPICLNISFFLRPLLKISFFCRIMDKKSLL